MGKPHFPHKPKNGKNPRFEVNPKKEGKEEMEAQTSPLRIWKRAPGTPDREPGMIEGPSLWNLDSRSWNSRGQPPELLYKNKRLVANIRL